MADEQQAHDDDIVHYEGGIPVFKRRLDNLEYESRKAKERDEKYKDEQIKLNRRLVWFTGVLAAVGLIGSAISGYQAHVAKLTADAAGDNAAAAKGMVEEMKQARSQSALASANAISAQQGIAQTSLSASQGNFEKSSQTAENTFRGEQRAWLGVLDISTTQFTEAQGWQAIVAFFNSGRSAARNVQISGMFRLSDIPISAPLPEDIKQLTFRPAQSVAPQGRYNAVLGGKGQFGEPTTLTQALGGQTIVSRFQDIKDKKLIAYYFGILKYDDIFGNPRETQFCIFLSDPGGTNQPAFCDGFNDLN